MAARMVVPPRVTGPGLALPVDGPAAALDAQIIGRGAGDDEPLGLLRERQACFSFLSSTSDFRTHSRATSRCSAEPTAEVRAGSEKG